MGGGESETKYTSFSFFLSIIHFCKIQRAFGNKGDNGMISNERVKSKSSPPSSVERRFRLASLRWITGDNSSCLHMFQLDSGFVPCSTAQHSIEREI